MYRIVPAIPSRSHRSSISPCGVASNPQIPHDENPIDSAYLLIASDRLSGDPLKTS